MRRIGTDHWVACHHPQETGEILKPVEAPQVARAPEAAFPQPAEEAEDARVPKSPKVPKVPKVR
nr:hypothetical protein GCM10020093_002800 [Planobispora longispora]